MKYIYNIKEHIIIYIKLCTIDITIITIEKSILLFKEIIIANNKLNIIT